MLPVSREMRDIMDDLNMMEQQKKMQQMEQQEGINSVMQHDEIRMEQYRQHDQKDLKKISQKKMSSYLEDQLGEKFDYSAPLGAEQEKELAGKNWVKRLTERRRMRQARKRKFEERAQSAWRMQKIQKDSAEIKPGVPENTMRMENMPVLGSLRTSLEKLSGMAPEQKQQALQMMNNTGMHLSQFMTNDIINTNEQLRATVNTEMTRGVIQNLTALKSMLNNCDLPAEEQKIREGIVQEIENTLQKFAAFLSKLADFSVDSFAYQKTMNEVLRMLGFGAVLRNEAQQQEFRVQENKLVPYREEQELIAKNKEFKKDEKRSDRDAAIRQSKEVTKRYRESMWIGFQKLGLLSQSVSREYKTRKNPFWNENFRLDSEGNVLLSDEPKFKESCKNFQKSYGQEHGLSSVDPELSQHYAAAIEQLVDKVRNMKVSVKSQITIPLDEYSRMNGMITEIQNIKTDEPKLYEGLSPEMKGKLKIVDKLGAFSDWFISSVATAGGLVSDAADNPSAEISLKKRDEDIKAGFAEEEQTKGDIHGYIQGLLNDYDDYVYVPENTLNLDKMMKQGQLDGAWDAGSITDQAEKTKANALLAESSKWLQGLTADQEVVSWSELKKQFSDQMLAEETTRLEALKEIVQHTPKWKHPETIGILDQLIGGLPKMFDAIKKTSYHKLTQSNKLRDIMSAYGLGTALRTPQQQLEFQKQEEVIHAARVAAAQKKETNTQLREQKLPESERMRRQLIRYAPKTGEAAQQGIQTNHVILTEAGLSNKIRTNMAGEALLKFDSEGNPLLSEEPRVKEMKEYFSDCYSKDPVRQQKASAMYAKKLEQVVEKIRKMDFSLAGLLKMPAEDIQMVQAAVTEIPNIRKDMPQLIDGLNDEMKQKIGLLEKGKMSVIAVWVAEIAQTAGLVVADNKPYNGELENDMKAALNMSPDQKFDINALIQDAMKEWDQVHIDFQKKEKKANKR